MDRWGLLAALLLVAPALSGCIALGSDGLITAAEAAEVARPVAADWSPNATLAVAIAEEEQNLTVQATNVTLQDPDVGDGRGFAWRLVYVAQERLDEAQVVFVLGNGTVHSNFTVQTRMETGGHGASVSWEERLWAVRDWTIDSDEAADIASKNETWSDLEGQATEAGFGLFGAPEDEAPLWIAHLEVDRGNESEGVLLFIDASSGELLDKAPDWFRERIDQDVRVDGMPGTGGGLATESGRFDGTLTLQEPSARHVFTIELEDHPELAIYVWGDPPNPAAEVSATLITPQGAYEASTSMMWSGGELFRIPDPVPGSYEVQLSLDQGALQRYHLCWEATGTNPYTDYDDPSGWSGGCNGWYGP